MAEIPYVAGLHRLSTNTYAYLQPPGTWGFSNSGLILGDGQAVLVDTQFTLPLTRDLLDAIARVAPDARLTTVVVTHANGDHCWGNQLIPEATTVASDATAEGMAHEITPEILVRLMATTPAGTPLGDYLRRFFGHFDFGGIRLSPPDRTFTGEARLAAGTTGIQLLEVGPAHTSGDVIVHVPDEGVVFAGDILFINDHPVTWTGPIGNWIAACERVEKTGAAVIVPGHGPVTDPAGVRLFRDYLSYVDEQARVRFRMGMPYWQAALDIELPGALASWGHRERLVTTLAAIYRDLGRQEHTDLMSMLAHTAEAYRRLSSSG
jgi:cyclase